MSPALISASWAEANHSLLLAEFARLTKLLGGRAEAGALPLADARAMLDGANAAIDSLQQIFDLTAFERDLLLLCAGAEMDANLAALCAKHSRPENSGRINFGAASSVLEDADWSALLPMRPLRHFRLLEMDASRGLASAPLRMEERILHFLLGTNMLDTRLQGFVRALHAEQDCIAGSHREVAQRISAAFDTGDARTHQIHLAGNDTAGAEDVAAAVAAEQGRTALALRVEDLPPRGPELDLLAQLLEREGVLLPALVLLVCPADEISPAARALADQLSCPVLLAGREALRSDRPVLRFDVLRPPPLEQRQLWQAALGDQADEQAEVVDALSEQFRLSARSIVATATMAQNSQISLWDACRNLVRPRVESLAQRVPVGAAWDDLVLPAPQSKMLHQMAAQVRHRTQVHQSWGFSEHSHQGLGISALFAGESGTGKSLAAQVLASELKLDLYRVDLSAVVSKYIGETERNLRQVFDAAEDGGVMLLFDESDAIFARRAEVKDSLDRYANIETAYLLQRMESFTGIAVLTTNFRTSLDRAFQRRLRFVISFPFPDATQREAIWRRAFPVSTPLDAINYPRLAQMNLSGGNIRNIALTAAFLAASSGVPVNMGHLLEAAHTESHKMERALSHAETRGWE
jgi:predicted nucleic acid-binding protein